MLTKEECLNSVNELILNWGYEGIEEDLEPIYQLINEHFDNQSLKFEERVKFLEKQLDIAIKDLCFTAKGADACNSLDDLYEGIRDRIIEQARREVQE